jgi:uncharacterized membrane protein YbjE (DUF340 family)
MTILPFISIGIGFAAGLKITSETFLKSADTITNIALVLLMLTIGANVGINDTIMSNLPIIGLNCVVISLMAIACSIILTLVCEKTVLPLEKVGEDLRAKNVSLGNLQGEKEQGNNEGKKKTSHLVWIMPGSIVFGVIFGYLALPAHFGLMLDRFLIISLIVLYVSVGIGQGANRKVFLYIKVLGLKVLFIPAAIIAGSLTAGLISSLALGLPLEIPLLSAGGMSFYSVTGAYMTQVYGAEAGTYGFIVNVMREFFTVLLLPLLIKISKGSPIAGGAAGNMDTMLAPVTKFVGHELGLVTLLTGTLLTAAVPILLPLLHGLV